MVLLDNSTGDPDTDLVIRIALGDSVMHDEYEHLRESADVDIEEARVDMGSYIGVDAHRETRRAAYTAKHPRCSFCGRRDSHSPNCEVANA